MSAARPRRPASSASLRPSSSPANFPPRPLSSASLRPSSELTRRVQSRLGRANQTKLLPLCDQLVNELIDDGGDEDIEALKRQKVDYVLKGLNAGSGGSSDMGKVQKVLSGHIEKAMIQSHDSLALALDKAMKRLENSSENLDELDDKITPSKMAAHISLLLLLSTAPSTATLAYAETYPVPEEVSGPPPLSWNAILQEEPFEGDHWETYSSDSSSDSLSVWSDNGVLSLASRSPPSSPPFSPEDVPEQPTLPVPLYTPYAHRREIEALQAKQYWRDEWKMDIGTDCKFDIGDSETLGPALAKITHSEAEKYIYEEQAVREVLIMLQGLPSTIFRLHPSSNPAEPRLRHLSKVSQNSILANFRELAIQLNGLRTWAKSIVMSPRLKHSRTIEAFADAVEGELRAFDSWCASREEDILRAYLGHSSDKVISLLATDKALRDDWVTKFELLDELVRASPQAIDLLDRLFQASLLDGVFVRCASPLWGMMGQWLSVGAEEDNLIWQTEQDFFIQCDVDWDLGIMDPMFWADGYVLRKNIPIFLRHIASSVLGAGKGIGLLKALRIHPPRMDEWHAFGDIVQRSGGESFMLERIIHDELSAFCEEVGSMVVRAITDQCSFKGHLGRVHSLYYLQAEMTLWADVIFTKMDTSPVWTDFHFLNTAFNDSSTWDEKDLVRISYHRVVSPSIHHSVRALEGLALEYAIPFPLTYIFTPEYFRTYNQVFILLMQVKRAKWVLESILVRGGSWGNKNNGELKVFWALRSRFSWFINNLLNFLMTYVLHVQTTGFTEHLDTAKSLDEIISLHAQHLQIVERQCLLQASTASLHRAVISILDMALAFTDLLRSFVASDPANRTHSFSVRLKHRSRRQRKQRKNVVGSFIQPESDSSDSDSDNEDMGDSTASFDVTHEEQEDTFARLEKMGKELDGLVRFIRRGVEGLTSSNNQGLDWDGKTGLEGAFGIWAFGLEEWDL